MLVSETKSQAPHNDEVGYPSDPTKADLSTKSRDWSLQKRFLCERLPVEIQKDYAPVTWTSSWTGGVKLKVVVYFPSPKLAPYGVVS